MEATCGPSVTDSVSLRVPCVPWYMRRGEARADLALRVDVPGADLLRAGELRRPRLFGLKPLPVSRPLPLLR